VKTGGNLFLLQELRMANQSLTDWSFFMHMLGALLCSSVSPLKSSLSPAQIEPFPRSNRAFPPLNSSVKWNSLAISEILKEEYEILLLFFYVLPHYQHFPFYA